jgi:hypothetical protein
MEVRQVHEIRTAAINAFTIVALSVIEYFGRNPLTIEQRRA